MESKKITYENSVLSYFKEKASGYDRVDEQVYWRLSDDLLWHFLRKKVLDTLPTNFKFLDAGGGTGRWSFKILQNYKNCVGTLRDLSPDMLEQARPKQRAVGEDRLTLSEGKIEAMTEFPDNAYDLIFNFHNVIGFLDDPLKAFQQLSRMLKPNGYLVTVAPNFYHMIFFNLSAGRLDEASRVLEEKCGTFVKGMPSIKVFTPSDIENLYSNCGVETCSLLGFPLAVYPGYQETQLDGSTQSLMDALGSEDRFNLIRTIEMELIERGGREAAARGNNLFVVGRKTA